MSSALVPPADGAGAACILAWAQAVTTEKIEKAGRASFGGGGQRAYFQEPAVVGIVKALQAKRPFALIVDFTEHSQQGNLRTLVARVRLIDVTIKASDHHDRILEAFYPIEATDSQGWGFAKAQTYGVKFAIQKFLQIPTDALPEQEIEAEPVDTTKSSITVDEALKESLRADALAAKEQDEAFTNRFVAWMQSTLGVASVDLIVSNTDLKQARKWIASETKKG